jgi:hypothetical protein
VGSAICLADPKHCCSALEQATTKVVTTKALIANKNRSESEGSQVSIKRTTAVGVRSAKPSKKSYLSSTIALILASSGTAAYALPIDIGNPDFDIRWDNTVRYNVGVRMEKEDSTFSNNSGYDDTEHKFGRGDVVTNRLDLISELDVVYKGAHGFRVSGAGWYDQAYQDSAEPSSNATGNYANNHYNSYANRYISGPSGEFLDAFVFTNFDIGNMSANVKAGQHNVYWGESLYTIGNSIAYSQGPVDTIKSATSPGSEAKELFLPLKQVSTTVQLTDELALGAQYLLDWKPFRLIPGGTFFGTGDGSRSDFASVGIRNGDDIEPNNKHGNFGVNLRWSPWWLEGTMGLYYRKFDEKLPWSSIQVGPDFAPSVRLSYARDTELYGFSISKNLATVSVAAELSYRKDSALNSNTSVVSLGQVASYSQAEGARGDTWHALVNAIYLLPRTALWEGGTLQGEISYNNLAKITENEGRFNSKGHGCDTSVWSGQCADNHSLGMQVGFTPEWPQLFPGWDVSLPTSLAYGIDGNSPTLGGTNEGQYSYSVGVTGKWKNLHNFTVRWADAHYDYKHVGAAIVSNGQNAVQNDHGWLSFTYKATF